MLVRRADSYVNTAADRAGGNGHADRVARSDSGTHIHTRANADSGADVDTGTDVDPRADLYAAPDVDASSHGGTACLADVDADGRAHGHVAARAPNVAATTRPDGYLASHGYGHRYTDTETDGHAHCGAAAGAWVGVHRGGHRPMGVRRRGLCRQARHGTLEVYGRA